MHKTWPFKHLTEQRRKRSQKHAYSSSFWHKTVATPSNYTKVDTVARASTCDSCFRRAIADTKWIDKYRLLLVEKTPQGTQTQLLAARKKRTSFSVIYVQPKCLWVRAIVWQVDRSTDSRTITYQCSSAKRKVAKISTPYCTVICDIALVLSLWSFFFKVWIWPQCLCAWPSTSSLTTPFNTPYSLITICEKMHIV